MMFKVYYLQCLVLDIRISTCFFYFEYLASDLIKQCTAVCINLDDSMPSKVTHRAHNYYLCKFPHVAESTGMLYA